MCSFLCRMQGRQSVIHHCHKYETKFILCLFFLRWQNYGNPSSHPSQPPPELLITILSFWGCSGGLCYKLVSLIKFLWHMPKNREMKTNRADRLWWKDVFGYKLNTLCIIKPLNAKTKILVKAIGIKDCDDFWGTKDLRGEYPDQKEVWSSEM